MVGRPASRWRPRASRTRSAPSPDARMSGLSAGSAVEDRGLSRLPRTPSPDRARPALIKTGGRLGRRPSRALVDDTGTVLLRQRISDDASGWTALLRAGAQTPARFRAAFCSAIMTVARWCSRSRLEASRAVEHPEVLDISHRQVRNDYRVVLRCRRRPARRRPTSNGFPPRHVLPGLSLSAMSTRRSPAARSREFGR